MITTSSPSPVKSDSIKHPYTSTPDNTPCQVSSSKSRLIVSLPSRSPSRAQPVTQMQFPQVEALSGPYPYLSIADTEARRRDFALSSFSLYLTAMAWLEKTERRQTSSTPPWTSLSLLNSLPTFSSSSSSRPSSRSSPETSPSPSPPPGLKRNRALSQDEDSLTLPLKRRYSIGQAEELQPGRGKDM